MPRLAWLTDIHFNFLTQSQVDAFLDTVVAARPDAVMLGGDIGDARDVFAYLTHMAERIACPMYFVLGNHDFYFGSIAHTRQRMAELCQERPNLHYLTLDGPHELSPTLGLVGDDGWADARLGNYEQSYIMMSDYKLIAELSGMTKEDRLPRLMQLGDEAAAHVRRVLPQALDKYPHVIFLTHVPPFRDACWHEGRLSNDEWSPHFTSRAVGDALLEIMRDWPERQLTVLCGHTHSPGECRPAPNIVVYTGGAEYERPAIQRVFEFE